MLYRKKPVVIEAYKWQTQLGNNRLMNWLAQHEVNIKGWTFFDDYLIIPTLEGDMKVRPDDYIIIGVQGEVYPCKPDIFADTYEEVTDLTEGYKALKRTSHPARTSPKSDERDEL